MREIKYLDQETVRGLLNSIDNPRDQLIFELIYLYGLRVSELTALRVEDIDLERGQIKIIPLKRRDNKSKFIFQMRQDLADRIRTWLDSRKVDSEYLFYGKRATLQGWHYDRMSRVNVYKLFRRYCQRYGIDLELAHPHTLRHSLAVAGASNGVDIFTTKEILRHSSVKTTEVYYQIMDSVRNQRLLDLHNSIM